VVSLEIFIDLILPVILLSWVRLSLWQNQIPGIFPGGKGGRCVKLTTLPPSYSNCSEIWEPQPHGIPRACPSLYKDCSTFYLYSGPECTSTLLCSCVV